MNNDYGGFPAGVSTDPEHLKRLKAARDKKPGVYEIRTYPSRILFDLFRPRPEDVRIDDVAHGLSMECRYGGHVPEHLSVARHSLLVADLAMKSGLPREYYGSALMHDAHEAYTKDIPKPLKNLLGRVYENIADGIQHAIDVALNLPPICASVASKIKSADLLSREIEQAAIERGDMILNVPYSAEDRRIKELWFPCTQAEAKELFLVSWNAWLKDICPDGQPRQQVSHSAGLGS